MLSSIANISDIILDSIAEGVFTVDKDMRIGFFNQYAEKITGVTKEQAIGQKCFDVFRANICQASCALRRSIVSGQNIVDLKVKILNKHGKIIPITISTSILRDASGKILGGVEIFRDISKIEALRKEVSKQYIFEDIISKNYKIQDILSTLPDIAESNSTVLIEGPSGSGKELFARAIHNLSHRKGKFIPLNCAALPDTLLESELFGYKAGAFTGAKNDKKGRFALAEKGTLFLDEIGDISPALQMKLLRVLQEKEYEPLGATSPIQSDVRVIAATNKTLKEMVSKGFFRDDLFFRLNVIKIILPTLAQRKEDIPLLVDHFITKFNGLKGKSIETVSPEVLNMLMTYDFPGNIRELENIIEYCFVLCHGTEIIADNLPRDFIDSVSALSNLERSVANSDSTNTTAAVTIMSNEASMIAAALHKAGGSKKAAADSLGIDRTTLWRRMKKYGL